ncbi:MAG TPA: lysylphosphatidylglycerol synthase transmembrane domain-containing protein [Candidatus Acidoferrum sp.]|nr:lysylphosphatidylglycerol synthase transmembrane domain-containing protein [Candidatus Acidoferrum sp.]
MKGAHQPAAKWRAWIAAALRWIAAIAVLGLMLHFLPFAPLRAALAKVPVTRFVIILVLYMGAHTVGIAKWRLVVNAAGAELDFASSAQCYLGGLFGTLFLPSIIGGDVVRLAVGLRNSPRPAAVLAGNVADRFLDVTAQGALVLLGLALLPGSVSHNFQPAVRETLMTLAIVVGIVAVLAVILHKPLLSGRSVRFRRRLARLRHALRSVRGKPHVLVLGWLMGIFIQGSFVMLMALMAMSCGLVLPLRVWLFGWPLAKIAALLPLTQGGMGVREVALVALLAPFGAPAALTLAAGLIWEGIIIAGGLIAGGVAFVLKKPAPVLEGS